MIFEINILVAELPFLTRLYGQQTPISFLIRLGDFWGYGGLIHTGKEMMYIYKLNREISVLKWVMLKVIIGKFEMNGMK